MELMLYLNQWGDLNKQFAFKCNLQPRLSKLVTSHIQRKTPIKILVTKVQWSFLAGEHMDVLEG